MRPWPGYLSFVSITAVLTTACGDERPPPAPVVTNTGGDGNTGDGDTHVDPVFNGDGDGDGDEVKPIFNGDGDGDLPGDGDGDGSGGAPSGGGGSGGTLVGGAPGTGGGGGSAIARDLYLFLGPWLASGDAAGRAGLDVMCRNSAPAVLENKTIHAFVSVDADDEIRDMPKNYGVPTTKALYAPDGTLLSNDWSTLLSADIPWSGCQSGNVPLTALFDGISSPHYITGSDRYGALDANCAGWTDDGGLIEIGGTLEFASGYYDALDCTVLAPSIVGCDFFDATTDPYVLCLAY